MEPLPVDMERLLLLVRKTLDHFVEVSAEAHSAGGNGDDVLCQLEEGATVRFREYSACFEKIWDAVVPVVSTYPNWQWIRSDGLVECRWGVHHRASLRLFRVGITAAVEVQTPVPVGSHLALLPTLWVGSMNVCDAATG